MTTQTTGSLPTVGHSAQVINNLAPQDIKGHGQETGFDSNSPEASLKKNDPESGNEQPPFKDFQQVLSFIASIGLATAVTSSFSMVGITSSFGDTSDASLAKIKQTAILLSWSSACFVVSLGFIVAPQLLYTEIVIVKIITTRKFSGWTQRLVRIGVGVFAWVSLGFQTAGMYLLSQALDIFGPRPAQMARYGLTAGVILVALVTMVGILSDKEGRVKFIRFLTCYQG